MGEEATARVRQHFTWEQVARSTLDVYERLRAQRPVPSTDDSWAVTA
jgi:glycosyltransferase involved in cell wall biosynthesis